MLGDLNGDGEVGFEDFVILALAYDGPPDSIADLDGDGDVDAEGDYNWVSGHQGETLPIVSDPLVTYPTQASLRNRDIPLASATTPLNEFGHQGLYHDEESGLVQNRVRMRSPQLGRWSQREPLGYIDGLSLYQYVRSNAVRYVDFTGQQTTTAPPVTPSPVTEGPLWTPSRIPRPRPPSRIPRVPPAVWIPAVAGIGGYVIGHLTFDPGGPLETLWPTDYPSAWPNDWPETPGPPIQMPDQPVPGMPIFMNPGPGLVLSDPLEPWEPEPEPHPLFMPPVPQGEPGSPDWCRQLRDLALWYLAQQNFPMYQQLWLDYEIHCLDDNDPDSCPEPSPDPGVPVPLP